MERKNNFVEVSEFDSIFFLDIDGVFNCNSFYTENGFSGWKDANKQLKRAVKKNELTRMEYYSAKICKNRLLLFSELCKTNNAAVVLGSTWRKRKNVVELQEIFDHCGGTFKIIGFTPILAEKTRGEEIELWLKENYQQFNPKSLPKYVIVDDGDDMLESQKHIFFQTSMDHGLTQGICENIQQYLTKNK